MTADLELDAILDAIGKMSFSGYDTIFTQDWSQAAYSPGKLQITLTPQDRKKARTLELMLDDRYAVTEVIEMFGGRPVSWTEESIRNAEMELFDCQIADPRYVLAHREQPRKTGAQAYRMGIGGEAQRLLSPFGITLYAELVVGLQSPQEMRILKMDSSGKEVPIKDIIFL